MMCFSVLLTRIAGYSRKVRDFHLAQTKNLLYERGDEIFFGKLKGKHFQSLRIK